MIIEPSPVFFSIIIPTYNGADRIKECLKSIQKQDFPRDKFEVIIVDDASPNKIEDSIKQINNTFDIPINLRVIRCEHNRRRGGALNYGFSEARGKYLLNIDDDDYFEQDAFKIIYENLIRDEVDVLMFTSVKVIDGKKEDYVPFLDNSQRVMTGEEFITTQKVSWETWRYVINTKFFRYHDFRLAENVLFEDADFSLNLIASSSKIKFIPNVLIFYTIRRGQLTKIGSDFKKIDQLFQSADRVKGLYPKFFNSSQSAIKHQAIFKYKILLRNYVWRLSPSEMRKIIETHQPDMNLESALYNTFYKYPSLYIAFSYFLKPLYFFYSKFKK